MRLRHDELQVSLAGGESLSSKAPHLRSSLQLPLLPRALVTDNHLAWSLAYFSVYCLGTKSLDTGLSVLTPNHSLETRVLILE